MEFDERQVIRADAPGRVNLIGEHTDYNGGFVLPTAIPQRTYVELRVRPGGNVSVSSANMGVCSLVSYAIGEEKRAGAWSDYVLGVTFVLGRSGFGLQGFDARIRSDVPLGAGLSSSAALAVALLRALREAFALHLDDVQLAILAQRAENEFVGAPVGLMDPLASSLADAHTALLIDTRSVAIERIPLPPAVELVVIDSGIAHDHATGDYGTRRAECERAAALLGVRDLRDAGRVDLGAIARLPDPLAQRARHVITENARVLEAAACLRAGDLERLGELFAASHASMRDDFELSVPAVDRLVAIAAGDPEIHGARLTGGGFGGAVVALARAGSGAAAAARIARAAPGSTVLVPSA